MKKRMKSNKNVIVAAAKAEEHEKRGVVLQRAAFRRDIIYNTYAHHV